MMRPTRTQQTKLTAEQAAAVCATNAGVFIEAYPGSGKTTVASERFGALRFAASAAGDPRAVVATSFTKAATRELRTRILRSWGPVALRWPHRAVTVDTLLREVLVWLLKHGHIAWAGGATDLVVHDSWRGAVETISTRVRPVVQFDRGTIIMSRTWTERHAYHPSMGTFQSSLRNGICTHDEVRAIMLGALEEDAIARHVGRRLKETVRALIIDEAFDANDLDVAFLHACLAAQVSTTIIGDPWQALYEFRGAKPRKVRALIERPEVTPFPLTTSFRWRSEQQRALTEAVRASAGTTLIPFDEAQPDVALADTWKALWEADERILPLALGSAKHDLAYAGASLVLARITRARFGLVGPFTYDARATLGLTDVAVATRAETWAEELSQRLAADDSLTPREAYEDMAKHLGSAIGRRFPDAHHSRYLYFKWLAPRARSSRPLVMGMTVHQAKGQEWDRVAVVLSPVQVTLLENGLQESEASHRALYVACTRARIATSAWPESAATKIRPRGANESTSGSTRSARPPRSIR